MPAYNAEKTIALSIDSVISQTYDSWELIVVDDASSDTTAQIVCTLATSDSRIRLLTNKRNKGVANARNLGVKHAYGEWVAFLDSDDCWCNSKLQQQLDFMSETSAKISFTSTSYVNENNICSNYVLHVKRKIGYRDLLKANVMSCSSVIACRDLLLRYPFPEGNLHEDYAVWLQILKEVAYAYGLDKPLLRYRMSDSSKSGNRVKSAGMIYRAYRKAGYNAVLSALLALRYGLHSVSKRFHIRRGW